MSQTAVTPHAFPLTAAQRDIWLDQLSRGDSPLYNIGGYVELTGPVSPQLMQRAIEQLVQRHDALRTVLLAGADGLPLQSFARELPVRVPLHDFSAQADPLAQAQALMQQQMEQVYALYDEPLSRFFLVRLDAEHHLLGTQAHHLILDGWGFGQMLLSLGDIYSALAQGESPQWTPTSYTDFIADDAHYQQSPRYLRDRAYWLDKYRSVPEPLLEPRYHTRDRAPSNSLVQAFPVALHERMKQLAKSCQASAFHVLLAALYLYFTRTAQRGEWAVGLPILNRSNARFKSTLGLFTQVSAARFAFDRNLGFAGLVRGIRDVLRQDFRHQRFPLSEMNRALGLLREDRGQLFDLSVSYEQDDHDYRYGAALAHTVKVSNRHEPLPLSIHLRSNRFTDKAWVHLVYNEGYFQKDEVAALAERLFHVLEQGLEDPALALSAFSLSTPGEAARLQQWNATHTPAPLQHTLHGLFEAQVQRTPEAPALQVGERQLTYRELNVRANQLAHHLRGLGVQPDSRVAICIERSVEMLVGLLAILKAGGAYVPLDPAYPLERLAYMLQDSAPVALLVHGPSHDLLGQADVPRVDLDQPVWQRLAMDNPQVPGLTAQHLAYVIYTSGSTGTPKGVMVEHRSVGNLLQWSSLSCDAGPDAALLQKTPCSFDASVWELFWPLTCGMRLVLARPGGHREPAYLVQLIRAQHISVIQFVPAMLALFLEVDEVTQCGSLREVFCGGGELSAALARRFRERLPQARLHNVYGPTETTVDSTVWTLAPGAPVPDIQLPIGRPISNTRLYVLDEHDAPLPIGASGQLHIGGVGVTRGYLGLPQLQAERFIDSPFVAGDRLYRTGDRVRYRADGNLEFLGRNDFQVKLHGLRVELGEIEAGLASHPALREVLVLMRDERLVAYFTPRIAGQAPAIEALRAHGLERLPEPLVPSAYVQLEAMPLTPNGKLDRQALPAPDRAALIVRGYQEPLGATEIVLAQLWAEVLKVERVGRHDHFFELGGHSLLAVTLIERMRQQGLSADVQVLFGQPTLATLAAAVGRGEEVAVPANRVPPACRQISPDMLSLAQLDQPGIERIVAGVPGGAANVQEIYPLAPLQEGLLYHHMTAKDRDPYQQHALFAFDGRESLEAFVLALQQVIARHDILRTSLVWDSLEHPMQVVWRQASLNLEEVSLEPLAGDIAEQLAERFDPTRRPLDLRRAPMLALACAEDRANRRWIGLLRFHHLVNDATSTAVLIDEIHAHLDGRQAHVLPPVAYRNYVAQARQGLAQAGHESFFRELLADVDEPTLAFGLQEYQLDRATQEQARCRLADDLGQRLRVQARQAGVSAASLYHLAWAQVLGGLSGRDDVVFGTVLLGRLQAGSGADRALGMFINTLPLRVRLAGRSVASALRDTHHGLSALLAHEHAPLALAQRCSAVAAPTPLFNSLLNYRHVPPPEQQARALAAHGIRLLGSEEVVSYPLMLAVDDLESEFCLTARAPAGIGASRLLDYLNTALEGLVQALEQAPQTPLRQLPILPDAERQRLLVELNATAESYPHDQTIHALIEAQVLRTPKALALVAGERQLSYGELNAQANRLAHHLRGLGVGPDVRVAICVERGLELLIGLLAILKAGGAYVPLDPAYPPERIAYMLHDSAPAVVLVHGATRQRLEPARVALIDLDQCHWHDLPSSNPQVPGLNVSHLAYVIYTSGSTGTPKGVMVEHRGLSNLVHWSSQLCPGAERGSLLQKAPCSFDGSVWELFWPLTTGMRMVLARPDGHREPAYLARLIREQAISVVKFVPAMLQQFLELDEVGQCHSLTDVFAGGGELTAVMARRFQQRLPHARLHNVYGPTEATVDSTAWTLEPGAPVPEIQLPIGRPICNTRLYVLDANDRPVPLGASGQLHIGGVGVARGYQGLPELMAERFIDSPFVAGDRLYRTGDLVRYRADGNLEFLGRNDFQVKLHGLRVELGEIEARLASHPALREVVVLMRDERLVAYYTLRVAGQVPTIEALRAHVLEQLPDYMVPSAYVPLAALPLSPNGKLDRQALPAPGQDSVIARHYEPPQGATEIALARIWAEVLKIERVGRHDNFFELGGHSLLAVSLVARMRQAGLNADARVLFSQPTLAALAARAVAPVQRVEVPLTSIPQLNRKRRL